VFSQRDAHLSLFHLLINAADCDVNIADKLGWTPLYQAATSGEDGQRSFIYLLASCLIYARALLEYVGGLIFIMWLRSVIKILPPVKFAENKVLTFLILREKC